MEIILNGKPRDVNEGTSISELLSALDLAGRRVAVEVNEEIVPRGQHGSTQLAQGDRVEVVQAVGGG